MKSQLNGVSGVILFIISGIALSAASAQETIESSIQPPEYFTRVEVPATGFVSSLRGLEIYADREILAGDGKTIFCAADNIVAATEIQPFAESSEVGVDGILRLWGDYLWKRGNRMQIAFPIDNGQVVKWEDWYRGMRPRKKGGKFIFTQVTTPDGRRANYEKYLAFVAEEMGAIALRRESEIVFDDSLSVGDLLVSYRENKQSWVGLVLDMVKGPLSEKLYLIGTSGVPSTTFYIMRPYSPVQGLNEWFTLEGAKWAIGEGARVDLRRVRLE